MAPRVIVRFSETQGYDINYDEEVVRFMATTSSGSFWSDVFVEGPRSLRKDREEFKTTVVDLIRAGQPPCYVELHGEEH
jgi:hypothetical protein